MFGIDFFCSAYLEYCQQIVDKVSNSPFFYKFCRVLSICSEQIIYYQLSRIYKVITINFINFLYRIYAQDQFYIIFGCPFL